MYLTYARVQRQSPSAGEGSRLLDHERADRAPVDGGVGHRVVVRLPVILAGGHRPVSRESELPNVAVLVAFPMRGPDEVTPGGAALLQVPEPVELVLRRDRDEHAVTRRLERKLDHEPDPAGGDVAVVG